MASKALFSIFLIILCSSSFHNHQVLCDSTNNLEQLLPGLGGQSDVLKDAQCMQKLLPCQQFLKDPSNPTQACCVPLKQIHENETDCLCKFLNNPQFLQSVNVSKEDVLKVPAACGIKVDVSMCNTATTSATTTEESPEASEGEGIVQEEDTATKDSTSSTSTITPYVPAFVTLMSALVFSVY